MGIPNNSPDMGPLPKRDRNAELQTESLQAIQSILPKEQFLFRDERMDDAGVDASLELLIASGYTNCRAQVQLKGTDAAHTNTDGSISLSVDVSNLNYLLNGPCPLYVLYIAPRDELRFVWASEEMQRITQSTPGWKQQGTVTLHFRELLTPEALEGIHARVLRETRLQRDIREMVGRSRESGTVVTHIDPVTLASTDPGQVCALLQAQGFALISSGQPALALDLFEMLSPADKRLPVLQQVCAHAHFDLGRYQEAEADIARVLLQPVGITANDQVLLQYLRNACRLQLGHIDQPAYTERQRLLAEQDTGSLNLAYRLERAREKMLSEIGLEQRVGVFETLRTLLDEVATHTDQSPKFKLSARLMLLHGEGLEQVMAWVRASLKVSEWQTRKRALDVQAFWVLEEGLESWETQTHKVLQEAENMQHSLLIGDILSVRVEIRTLFIEILRSIPYLLTVVPQELVDATRADAERACVVYAQAGNLQRELNARMALAEFQELCGARDMALEIAAAVLPKAQAMEYEQVERRTQHFLAGDTSMAFLTRITEADPDVQTASSTDEEVRQAAACQLHELGLPMQRLPILERQHFSMRGNARERLHWCRHLQLFQNLLHTFHPSTHFRQDPFRTCQCLRLGCSSPIPTADWEAGIAAFKNTYCQGCAFRDPKEQYGDTASVVPPH